MINRKGIYGECMSLSFSLLMEALILVVALSVDSFVASFAYGANKIKIPLSSILIINGLCSGILVVSLFIGGSIQSLFTEKEITYLCFFILFTLGILKLFDSSIKMLIQKYEKGSKRIQFRLKRLTFILTVYAAPETADVDKSHTLSPMESITLGIALSLDSAVVGLGTGTINSNYFLVLALSLIIGFIAIYSGDLIGEKIAAKSSLNLSWISGALLILLAFLKLF